MYRFRSELDSMQRLHLRLTAENFPVRNVYFSYSHDCQTLSDTQLKNYFQIFGEIHSMRTFPKPTYSYGFVSYKQPQHAALVLRQFSHKIFGVCVRVKEADERHQPKIPLEDGPVVSNSCNTHISQLNNDCIQEIFSYLNVEDLLLVAGVCQQFKEQAQHQFSIQHKIFDFSTLINLNLLDSDHICDFLKNFGALIKKLTVRTDDDLEDITSDRILYLVVEHCGDNLDDLTLFDFELKGPKMQKLRPLFARLQKLELSRCQFAEAFIKTLTYCSELRELKISNSISACKKFRFNFPKLETLSVTNFIGSNVTQLRELLEHNPQLKNLEIIDCSGIDTNIFSAIVKYTPLIEKISFKPSFEIEIVQRDLDCLKHLKTLQKLKIDCRGTQISTLVSELAKAKVPLEYLDLKRCSFDALSATGIANINSIKTLSLRKCSSLKVSHMLEICENLNELRHLNIDSIEMSQQELIKMVLTAKNLRELDLKSNSIEFNSRTYIELVGIVKNREERIPLKLTLRSKSMVDLSLDTIKTNEQYLQFSRRFADLDDSDDDDDDDDDEYSDSDYDDDIDLMYYLDSDDEFIYGHHAYHGYDDYDEYDSDNNEGHIRGCHIS